MGLFLKQLNQPSSDIMYLLKLGGSIITHKDKEKLAMRDDLLARAGQQIYDALKNQPMPLAIVHGAGSFGHRLAKKYNLDKNKSFETLNWNGALETLLSCQKLNLRVCEILYAQGLKVVPYHTADFIMQKNGEIENFALENFRALLNDSLIPVFYGSMARDSEWGFSICSGDKIIAYLTRYFGVERVLLATDVDGVFNRDPHVYKNSQLVENLEVDFKNKSIKQKLNLSVSHSEDVTDGMRGKIKAFLDYGVNENLKEILVFNGLKESNYYKALLSEKMIATKIMSV